MAARGLVNGRDPRSGRDLVFRCYPPGLLTPPKKQKLTFWASLSDLYAEDQLFIHIDRLICDNHVRDLALTLMVEFAVVIRMVYHTCCLTPESG